METPFEKPPIERGFYTPERKVTIKGIPSVITDPHAEVLPLWLEYQGKPALLVHIDHHADMDSGAPTLEQARHEWTWEIIDTPRKYAQKCLSVANFTAVAVHSGKVGVVYWYDPREGSVKSYGGRVSDNNMFFNQPTTTVNNRGRIMWRSDTSHPIHEDISLTQTLHDIASSSVPIILDIDLDAFLCIKDPVGQDPNIMFERLKATADFIKSFKRKPVIITIARSQTPTLWAPPIRLTIYKN